MWELPVSEGAAATSGPVCRSPGPWARVQMESNGVEAWLAEQGQRITALEEERTAQDKAINEQGQVIKEQGQVIKEQGQVIKEQGKVVQALLLAVGAKLEEVEGETRVVLAQAGTAPAPPQVHRRRRRSSLSGGGGGWSAVAQAQGPHAPTTTLVRVVGTRVVPDGAPEEAAPGEKGAGPMDGGEQRAQDEGAAAGGVGDAPTREEEEGGGRRRRRRRRRNVARHRAKWSG